MSLFTSALAGFILSVASTAQAGCFIAAGGMSFGAYNVADPFPRDTMLVLTVSCQEVQARDVSISIGPSANSGGIQIRQMKWAAGNDILSYNLFADASRTQVWGDGTSAAPVVVQGVTRDSPQQLVVFGRIPAGQNVSVGSYGDVIIVTADILR